MCRVAHSRGGPTPKMMDGLMKLLQLSSRSTGAALLALTFLGSAPARAQTQEDGGLWLLWLGQGNFGVLNPEWMRVRWWLDVQSRWRDEGETLDTTVFRPALG